MAKIDKAVLLAAGRGTRMREMTADLPKPMLEVRGKPVLQYIVEGLREAGVGHFLIVVGYRADAVQNFFGDGSRYKIEIQYATQTVQDGTGRVIELAKNFVGLTPFVLGYGDILVAPENYKSVVDLPEDIEALLSVTRGEDVTKGGLVFFDGKFCLKRLVEKPSAAQLEELRREGWLKPGDTAWYNAGIYIFRPSVFEFTASLQKSPRGEYELTDAVSALVAAGHVIAGMQIEGRWVDVRDPEVLANLKENPNV